MFPKNKRMLFFSITVLVLFLSIMKNPIISVSASTDLSPSTDSFVHENYPDSNYGGDNYLELSNYNGWARYSYLTFDLSSITSSARARLFVLTSSTSATTNVSVHEVLDTSWDEYFLTWNNKPSLQPNSIDWQITVTSREWLVFDITSLVQANIGNKISVVFISHSSGDEIRDTRFYSREYTTESRRPYLSIDTDLNQIVPEILDSPDKTIFFGTTGNSISWTANDNNPAFYNVSRDGVIVDEGVWDGNDITISVDGLNMGSYIYTSFVNDTDGNYATNDLSLFVIESPNIYPIVDNYVHEHYPSSNYGANNYLELSNYNGWTQYSYLTFDLSSIASIVRARLFVLTSSTSATTNVSVHEVLDTSWDEYFLTWNNRPFFQSNSMDWQMTVTGQELLVFDLTSLVQTKQGGLISLAFQSLSSGDEIRDTRFYSREYITESKRPYLSIDTDSSQIVPEIQNSPDKTIFLGTTGNSISWTANDNNPAFYNISRDGVIVDEGVWDGKDITISVDGLNQGSYLYTSFVNDTDGNDASDELVITCLTSGNIILEPLADNFVHENYPDSNYGASNYLELSNYNRWTRYSYLTFDIAIINSIEQAKLFVLTSSTSATTNVSVHEVLDTSWDEYILTWNNKPFFQSNSIDWQMTVTSQELLVFDITTLVQANLGNRISVVFISHSSGDEIRDTRFYSSEYTTESKRPYLNITGSGTFGPSITLSCPLNTTYTSSDVPLNFNVNTTYSWAGYSLDGASNVTLIGNTLLQSLSLGSHHLSVYAQDRWGNVGVSSVWFTVDLPPLISISSPVSSFYSSSDVWLNYSINEPISWIGYSLDDSSNITITGNTLLQSLSEGSHTIVIYATDNGGVTGVSNIISFSVDTVFPIITLLNPLNTVYITREINLIYSINEPSTWAAYSLDGANNVTITGDTLLPSLSVGSHFIVVYATDYASNTGFSSVWFTVNTPPGITITSPVVTLYSQSDIWLNYTVDEFVSWIGYSLDGAGNVTITGNTLLQSLSEGFHVIIIYATDTGGVLTVNQTEENPVLEA
ncbi:MAG: Gellan lyase precursor [Candidatus Heimdallarchaeota archaeon LC_3]|nr:MAG: Gellan lyase precursor [Candidatus Heimdallarchaeota archaeon LC_3]